MWLFGGYGSEDTPDDYKLYEFVVNTVKKVDVRGVGAGQAYCRGRCRGQIEVAVRV